MRTTPPQSTHSQSTAGFTLVELLTVIAVISILMTAGAIGIGGLTGGKGVGSGVAQAEAIFDEARTIAVGNNTTARVLVAKQLPRIGGANRNADDLRRIVIAYRNPANNQWEVASRGIVLPDGVFFSQQYSKSPTGSIPSENMNELQRAFQGEYFYYEFNSEGIATNPGAGFIVGAGVWPANESSPRVTSEAKRDFGGFVVWRNGRTSLYRSPSQMGLPSTVRNF